MRFFWTVWFLSLFVKLILAAFIPLSPDEAYYWVWSQRIHLSYFDHPPFVAWLFWLGSPFESLGHAVKWPFVILGHLSILFWVDILKKYLSDVQMNRWLWLVILAPFIGIGTLIATPDVPLLFFWSAATWSLERYRERPSLAWAVSLGISLGLGFCSKYQIVLFPLFACLYLAVSGSWRQIKLTHLLWAVLFFILFSSPVFIWNAQNDWASFVFQTQGRFASEPFSILWPLAFIGGQILALFPTNIVPTLKASKDSKWALHVALGWGPLVFFLFNSFRGSVEMNWTLMGYFSLLALAASQIETNRPIWIYGAFWSSLLILVLAHVWRPFIPEKWGKLNDPFMYELAVPKSSDPTPIYYSNYQMASFVWYKTKKPSYKLYGMSRRDFFDDLPESKPQADVFYLVQEPHRELPSWVSENGYTKVSESRIQGKFLLEEFRR